jgi:hypothetical protein
MSIFKILKKIPHYETPLRQHRLPAEAAKTAPAGRFSGILCSVTDRLAKYLPKIGSPAERATLQGSQSVAVMRVMQQVSLGIRFRSLRGSELSETVRSRRQVVRSSSRLLSLLAS